MSQEFRPRQVLIRADDMEAALAFYRDVLGLTVAFQDGNRYVAFEATPITIALAHESETSESMVLAYRVQNVPDATTELSAGGALVVDEPTRSAHEERATLRDPAGNTFNVYAPIKPS